MALYEILSLSLWAIITIVAIVTTGLKSTEAGYYKGLNQGYQKGFNEAKLAFYDTPHQVAEQERKVIKEINANLAKTVSEELLIAYGVGSEENLPGSVRAMHGLSSKEILNTVRSEDDDEIGDWR